MSKGHDCLGTIFVEITLGMNAFINTQGFARTGMVKLFFAFYRKMILLGLV